MPGVFVLGPSKWLDPKGVTSALSEPLLDVRSSIVRLGRRFDTDAFIMEDHPAREGETHSTLFRRLIHDHDVQTFLVLHPTGARLHGLEKEYGALLEWLELGWLSGGQVYILAEKALYQDSGSGGQGALGEPGNRTRYHEDFITHDVRLRLWDDRDSLTAHCIGVFTESQVSHHGRWYEPLHTQARPIKTPG